MKEEHVRWTSPHLAGREFEMLRFGTAGYPVVFFPCSLGRLDQGREQGMIAAVAPRLEAEELVIYCPDGLDGEHWYNGAIPPAERVQSYLAFQRVILDEVIERARRDTGSPRVALAGCGFGAYHALNVALRAPDRVGFLLCLSGAYDIRPFLAGYYDDDCYFNNPIDYLPGLDGWYLDRLREMGIVIGTGELDLCRDANRNLSRVLSAKSVEHWFDLWPEAAHDWPSWRAAFPNYLSQIGRN
jgi:esterase/lipase superfamily enzyme